MGYKGDGGPKYKAFGCQLIIGIIKPSDLQGIGANKNSKVMQG